MNFIIRWLVSVISLIIVAYLFKSSFEFSSYNTVLIAGLVLGLVNAIVRPIVIIFTLPVNILTLGLFTFIINAFMLWLVAVIVPGFSIANFWVAILAGIVYWLVSWSINALIKD